MTSILTCIGASFSAGDVLLEIETDKAQMDVEAQDDGKLFKILQSDGTKSIKVGTRIAVMAGPDDDLGKLELPGDSSKSSKQEEKKSETTEQEKDSKTKKPQNESTKEPDGMNTSSSETQQSEPPSIPQERSSKPLYPSVQALLHENKLSASDIKKIPTSGPQGRLLKGDVLAYIGKIAKDYPKTQSTRIEKLASLDMSNIKIKQPIKTEETSMSIYNQPPTTTPKDLEQETAISLPISLKSIINAQKRVNEVLGTTLPLSEFIIRASDMANVQLPTYKSTEMSEDELFNSILGIESTKNIGYNTGRYFPIIASTSQLIQKQKKQQRRKKVDIFDELISVNSSHKSKSFSDVNVKSSEKDDHASDESMFSVNTKQGDEKRALHYLERIKTLLENEPGRLIL